MLSKQQLSRINPQSMGWLTAALDPYHDFLYEVDGLPDEKTANSVVQVHNQSVSITAPASAAGGNWDASVLYSGLTANIDILATYAGVGGMITQSRAGEHKYTTAGLLNGTPFGSLTTWAGAAGSVPTWSAPHTAGDAYTRLGSVKGTDRARVIGVAFEIHNTTAEVYRQGTLSVAQLADVSKDPSTVTYIDVSGGVGNYFAQSDETCVVASSLAALLSVPGSQTWPAAEGVYAIPRMNSVPRNASRLGETTVGRSPIMRTSNGKIASVEPVGVSADGVCEFMPFDSAYFSPVQVYLTGLSSQTTLTVTFRTIVEYFPDLGSPLIPMADPSPPFDPRVFTIYSRVIQEAPYAVPVGQNSAGDYFRKVLRVVGRVIDAGSPVLGEYAPIGSLVGRAISTLGAERKRLDQKAAGKGAQQGIRMGKR